ncbi:MAG: DUF3800 domain-containing protein [Fimbriimonadaceae bacterium]|nr:DUF3800 domain-containing protein [Fimbriimonadaceae bacterium]QYK58042.1 MAG: DUF3800 domain-containing protein [Fimbriimonadaceae bacterium]
MLVFLDESYERDSTGTWHYALAGFGINEFRYRALQAAVYQLCLDTFDVRENYEGETWREALGEKIITESAPDCIELKSSELLKSGSLRRFGGEQSPHYRLVSQVLQKVYECRGTTVGVILNPNHPDDVKDVTDGCPRAYVRLIEVVAAWMAEEYEGQPVTLVMDTEHNGINLPLSRAIAQYMYRSAFGKRVKHVFPSPFWIDSQSMAGAQVADLMAHILMNAMKPEGERKQLQRLTSQVYGLSHRWQGRAGGTITRLRG